MFRKRKVWGERKTLKLSYQRAASGELSLAFLLGSRLVLILFNAFGEDIDGFSLDESSHPF